MARPESTDGHEKGAAPMTLDEYQTALAEFNKANPPDETDEDDLEKSEDFTTDLERQQAAEIQRLRKASNQPAGDKGSKSGDGSLGGAVGFSKEDADLFAAGLVVGVVLGLAFMVYVQFETWRTGAGSAPRASRQQRLRALRDGLVALGMPAIILGGIYGGIFTATEAAAVDHALRIQRNDAENVPTFYALGLVYVLSGASATGAFWYFWTYTVARVLHTVMFMSHLQPYRAICFVVGMLCQVGMAFSILF